MIVPDGQDLLQHILKPSFLESLDDEMRAERIERALYLAASELIANITRHSHATKATIAVATHRENVVLRVTDNGIGCATPSPGSGLDGIEQRVRSFDGTIEIDSPTAGPTVVTIELPTSL